MRQATKEIKNLLFQKEELLKLYQDIEEAEDNQDHDKLDLLTDEIGQFYPYVNYIVEDKPILEYLAENEGEWCFYWGGTQGPEKDIHFAFPSGTAREIVLVKMRSLIERRLVSGCACGCRGDFEITKEGKALVK